MESHTREKKVHKGIRIPPKLLEWLNKKALKSGRSFSGEIVHQLTLIMEGFRK